MEIRHPGRLYGNLTIDDLRQGNVSQRCNPLIADLFRRIQMTEAWGRGMPLILKHAPDAAFREVGNLFIVSFERPSFLEQEGEGEPAAQETTQNTTQEKILALLTAEPTLTRKMLAERLGITEDGVKCHRLQGRFAKAGRGALADYELLELLLTYGVPRTDTKPIATV
ncbi:MAG: hypothetical protein HY911_10845 [Desulfobacterales bacterium]|nr:hypothetical protein [Desulfobacterales bacterium]